MEGFDKIDLDAKNTKSVNPMPAAKKKRPFLKIILIIFAVLLILIILAGVILIPPAQKAYKDAKDTFAQVKVTVDALKKQDIVLASKELDITKSKLTQTQKDLDSMSYLKFVPFLNTYYSDSQHLTKAGFHGLSAAKVLLDSIEPYVDVLGLKGKGNFVSGTASQRIETAVTTMGKITPHIDDIVKYLREAKTEIDYVDPNRYPSFFGGDKIKKGLTTLRQLTDQGVTLITDARPLVKILPSLLGDPKEKKYLVLFQNDKELRPTGGFITAYAIFRIDKGVIHVDRSEDIYALDNGIYGKPAAPAPIRKYLPKVPLLNLRDSNLSPDFVESMKTFNSLYEKAAGRVKVDGIIALDTSVLVSTIKILDDEVYAEGIRFTSKEDKRCDCPQVIYELEDNISRPVNYIKANRKGLLGSLLYAIMDKALKSSPKLYWGPLFQDMLTQVGEKHVLFYIYDKDAQSGIEALNGAGRIRAYEGDYLHINESNFGGAKANLFTKETVNQNIDIGSDGVVTKKLTINYKNPYPPSDCNLERGDLCLNAVLRDWIRIYVPKGSKLLDSQGSEVKMTSYDELGKTVFEGFLTVRPKGVATFSLSYTLPFKVNGSILPLLIQKQPGTHDNEYIIEVRGKEINKFPLLTDKEIKIKL
ncbi:MAG: DUF4012 domain-containing protein [Patescibacteria group bacterium]